MKILTLLNTLSRYLIPSTKVITLSKTDIITISKSWKEPKVAIWYYIGSDQDFDYFHHMDIDKSNDYRVKKNEFKIEKHFPITKEHSKWQVMKWGPFSDKP